MEQKRKIADQIFNQPASVPVWVAEVVSVEGLSCTVKLVESELEIDDVRLVADPEAESYWLITPAAGSRVLVGLVENQLTDLCVLQVSEVEKASYKAGKVLVEMKEAYVEITNDKSKIAVEDSRVWLRHNQTSIQIAQKLEIKNAGVNLKDLFGDLVTLLNSFSVLTSTGPSAGLNPATMALLTQLQTKVNLLLE